MLLRMRCERPDWIAPLWMRSEFAIWAVAIIVLLMFAA